MLLFDAQTSGGPLLAAPPDKLQHWLDSFAAETKPGWVIGQVVKGTRIHI